MGESRRFPLTALGLAVLAALTLPSAEARAAHRHPGQAPGKTAARPAKDAAKQAQTEARMKDLQAQIAQARDAVSRTSAESDRLTKALRAAETDVGTARDRLDDLKHQEAEANAKRTALAGERQQAEDRLAGERKALAAQARLAWQLGRSEPLKLLLNQQDPARAGRMFAYYGYFGRARAARLASIQDDLAHLRQLDAELATQEQQLAQLDTRRSQELAQLDAARAQRSAALVKITAESQSSEQMLQRLLAEQAALANVLRDLAAAREKEAARLAAEARERERNRRKSPAVAGGGPDAGPGSGERERPVLPPAGGGAFAGLRGRLTWPVAGRVAARFGDIRAGGLRWDGDLIDTQRGADVKAVAPGRVVYADWLPGLGLLTIIDHGNGWLSLYGHNDRLFKSVGAQVQVGEVIASSGDTGGGARPQLYFGIRKGNAPQDPGQWFQAAQPQP